MYRNKCHAGLRDYCVVIVAIRTFLKENYEDAMIMIIQLVMLGLMVTITTIPMTMTISRRLALSI